DDQADVLAISYSTPDIIGHAFGPYSKEIEDTYIRLDLELKRLLETLDEKIGKKEYTLFLTADHAVVPVPQQLVDKGLPGGYLFLDQHVPALRQQLTAAFGIDPIEAHENLNFYLNLELIKEKGLDISAIKTVIMDEVSSWEGVKRVFDTKHLYSASIDDEWKDMVRKGYYPKESGDIMYILKPGYLPKSTDVESSHKGTSHGSAYSYDTHVPLLWYGKRIPAAEDFTPLEITDITPTLAHLLNLQLPNAVTGKPIKRILCK
ncbi:MAG: alkaline phosphatase family protein, partial [Crocinitomicaceae bacterium]